MQALKTPAPMMALGAFCLFCFLLDLRPGILKIHRQIENGILVCGVDVGTEISLALELEAVARPGVGK